MKNTKVSIIIPVYNAEKTIGNILDKLIVQEYKNIEIIVINDGSEDNSIGIIKHFANLDDRIVVFDQKNMGVSEARNIGIEHASGEYVCFIDSDDDIHLNLLVALTSLAANGIDFTMCGMSVNGVQVRSKNAYAIGDKAITRYVLMSLLETNLIYGPCCKLFSHRIVKEKNIRFPVGVNYGEDTVFVLNFLAEAASMKVSKETYYNYRISSTGLATMGNSVLNNRKARSEALNNFVKGKFNPTTYFLFVLVKARWCASYLKNSLTRRSLHE